MGRIFDQRAMERAREIGERKSFGRRMTGRQRDASRRARARELLHHAFHALCARETAEIGFPPARERLACGRRVRDERPFAYARGRAPSRGEQFVRLRNRDERAVQFARKVAHRRKAIARRKAFGLYRVDDAVGDLDVQRTRIARLQANP
jgi:hypothetical protein